MPFRLTFIKHIVLLSLLLKSTIGYSGEVHVKAPTFIIVDSWLTGYIGGFFSVKEHRFKAAWKKSINSAKNDARIWGGLFVSDTNLSNGKRFLECCSRLTYQLPQTSSGFLTAHYYNTILGKVNSVNYSCGASVLNCNVSWAGVSFGNYILARKIIDTDPNNKMFQHEYGHYLQSKRMGFAYFVRVGLPAIMSKGDHDAHPVEVDCNREGFLYFNRYYPNFKNDLILNDTLGWNFRYNPFPDSIGTNVNFKNRTLQFLDYQKDSTELVLKPLKIKARFLDYAGWVLPPAALIIGCVNARNYNKLAKKTEAY